MVPLQGVYAYGDTIEFTYEAVGTWGAFQGQLVQRQEIECNVLRCLNTARCGVFVFGKYVAPANACMIVGMPTPLESAQGVPSAPSGVRDGRASNAWCLFLYAQARFGNVCRIRMHGCGSRPTCTDPIPRQGAATVPAYGACYEVSKVLRSTSSLGVGLRNVARQRR